MKKHQVVYTGGPDEITVRDVQLLTRSVITLSKLRLNNHNFSQLLRQEHKDP